MIINLTNRTPLITCVYLYLISFFIISCQSGDKTQTEATNANTAQKMEFKDYPNLKLGFTTQNFLKVMPVTMENSKRLIDYAADQGFAWLELRDPDAVLTLEESKEIAEYAQSKGIDVIYAIQKGLLDEDFWSTFEKGVKNAAVFGGQKVIRSLASGAEFTNDESKKGWTQEELEKVVQMADSAATIAQMNDLQYVIENGTEAFFGNGTQYYGIADVFSRVSEKVGWQFDTANPFSVSRTHSTPDSIKAFFQEHIDNLYYIHLKSSQNGEAQPALTDNPLALEEVFQILSENKVPYIAIELQAVDSQDQVYTNMQQSIEYLKSQDFIINP